jgi:hypothetical protein
MRYELLGGIPESEWVMEMGNGAPRLFVCVGVANRQCAYMHITLCNPCCLCAGVGGGWSSLIKLKRFAC